MRGLGTSGVAEHHETRAGVATDVLLQMHVVPVMVLTVVDCAGRWRGLRDGAGFQHRHVTESTRRPERHAVPGISHLALGSTRLGSAQRGCYCICNSRDDPALGRAVGPPKPQLYFTMPLRATTFLLLSPSSVIHRFPLAAILLVL